MRAARHGILIEDPPVLGGSSGGISPRPRLGHEWPDRRSLAGAARFRRTRASAAIAAEPARGVSHQCRAVHPGSGLRTEPGDDRRAWPPSRDRSRADSHVADVVSGPGCWVVGRTSGIAHRADARGILDARGAHRHAGGSLANMDRLMAEHPPYSPGLSRTSHQFVTTQTSWSTSRKGRPSGWRRDENPGGSTGPYDRPRCPATEQRCPWTVLCRKVSCPIRSAR